MTTGELTINTIINYEYDNLKNDINRFTHLYQFYDDKGILFYTITLDNHDFSTHNENILNINDNFCFNLNNNINRIKIVLSITRINQWGTGDIKLEMIDENLINIIYTEKIGIQKNLMKMMNIYQN